MKIKLKWLTKLLHPLIPKLIVFYSHIIGATCSLTILNLPGVHDRSQFVKLWQNRGGVFACWHARFFYLSCLGKGTRTVAMVSPSRDGELIAKTLHSLRMSAVRGSSSRDGRKALSELVECVVKRNRMTIIMPDGPRGPRYQAKIGILYLAQQAQLPIVTMTTSCTRGLFISSWDHFMVPFPFCKIVVNFGKPIVVPEGLSDEELEPYRIEFEQEMERIRLESDKYCQRDSDAEIWPKRKQKK